jgi:cytochrome c peroxidase
MFNKRKASTIIFMLLIVVCASQSCFNKQPSIEKTWVELGKFLFFDNRLSVNNTRSCATCHNPQLGFTDGYKRSLGAYADVLQHNTLPLFNLQQQQYYTWADSSKNSLLQQMNNPMFAEHPIEMGLKGNEQKLLSMLQTTEPYKSFFKKLDVPIKMVAVQHAIASFVTQITSYNSNYDKFQKGDTTALTPQAKMGMQLFFSEKLPCTNCHAGKNFSEPKTKEAPFFNTGIYNVSNKNSYPKNDLGLQQFTGNGADNGKFKVPSLRNLLFTAPYYHDGSAENLLEVLDNYNTGGRNLLQGEFAGNGRLHKNKHESIQPLGLSQPQKLALIAFLYALTDSSLLKNPAYQNPF